MKKFSILIVVVGAVALLELLPAPKASAYFEEHRGFGRPYGGVIVRPYLGGGGYNGYGRVGGYGYTRTYIYGGAPIYRTYPNYGGGYYFNPGYSYPAYPNTGYGSYPGYGYGARGFYE